MKDSSQVPDSSFLKLIVFSLNNWKIEENEGKKTESQANRGTVAHIFISEIKFLLYSKLKKR